MLIIVGLGNPGTKYTLNRHNVGFMFADYLLKFLTTSYQLPTPSYKFDKYTNAEIAKLDLQATTYKLQTIIAKPQTFMNRSGDSVSKLVKNYDPPAGGRITNAHTPTSYQLPTTSLFIVHDDLDMTIGNFKIQKGVGPKMHNGLSSIEQHVHTQDFWRIRIGVDNRQGDRTLSGEEYVLQNFSKEELNLLQDTFPQIKSRFDTVLKEI